MNLPLHAHLQPQSQKSCAILCGVSCCSVSWLMAPLIFRLCWQRGVVFIVAVTMRKEEGRGRLSKFLTPCFGTFINLCLRSCKSGGWCGNAHKMCTVPYPRDLPSSGWVSSSGTELHCL